MDERNKLTQWIDLNDQIMCQWVMTYLKKAKRNHYPSPVLMPEPSNREANSFVRYIINSFDDTPANRELISRMRSAWRQERYRRANKAKSKEQYSFVLSRHVSKELDNLSKHVDRPRNETLALLISKQYEVVRDRLHQAKEDRAKLKLKKNQDLARIRNQELMNKLTDVKPAEELRLALEERDKLQERYDQLANEFEQLHSKIENQSCVDKGAGESAQENQHEGKREVKMITLKRKNTK
ncbi:hypothetical protein [Amphritea sp.]|uniref:hypothetical protein n=1 Tax=Amphritea sp. TaxID=1872502 RepID=UPI003A8D2DF3